MKLTCQQESLKKGLATVSHAVPTKSPLPILLNVLLVADNGRIKLAATDLEIGITCWIGARVEVEGGITLPAKLFSDVISNLPAEKLTLTVDQTTQTLKVECGRFTTNLKGITADDFPPIPTITEQEPLVKIPPDMLREAIDQVAFAAATDESRPVLTGVLLRPELGSEDEGEGDLVTLAAADGFRLAVRKLNLPLGSVNLPQTASDNEPTDADLEADENDANEENEAEKIAPKAAALEYIIPAKAFAELGRIIGTAEEDVEITVTKNGNQVLFHTDMIELVSQLIDGKFPDFERIIPTEYTTRSLMETSELLKAVKLAALFANISQNIVKLVSHPGDDVSPGKLVISANAAELGDNTGEVDGIVHGEGGQVATNVKYLTDALNAIRTAQVAIEAQTAQSPVVFKPVGNSNLLQIVMPMSIRN